FGLGPLGALAGQQGEEVCDTCVLASRLDQVRVQAVTTAGGDQAAHVALEVERQHEAAAECRVQQGHHHRGRLASSRPADEGRGGCVAPLAAAGQVVADQAGGRTGEVADHWTGVVSDAGAAPEPRSGEGADGTDVVEVGDTDLVTGQRLQPEFLLLLAGDGHLDAESAVVGDHGVDLRPQVVQGYVAGDD